jgi:hypothetical protein
MNNPWLKTLQVLIFSSGLLLITGTVFRFQSRFTGWATISYLLMAVCFIGYIFFTLYAYKTGNKQKFKQMALFGGLIILLSIILSIVL